MKTHPHIKTLIQHQKWRRGDDRPMLDPKEIGIALDWAIRVCEAADNLVNVKGRHHSEQAYKRLDVAVNSTEGAE